MTNGRPFVSCREAGRTHRTRRAAVVALRAATCDVWPGQRIALVGPSGSGKSTLLHLIADLDRPSNGTVEWPGLPGQPRSLPPGTVGVVFQGPSLVQTLDVTENVALPLILAGASKREANEQARRTLEIVGLDELSARLPDELSGGQAQRVAVTRTLAARPRLVLADEPTGQLDGGTATELITTLLQVLHPRAALVVATHDLAVADRLESRWFLEDGRLESRERACSP